MSPTTYLVVMGTVSLGTVAALIVSIMWTSHQKAKKIAKAAKQRRKQMIAKSYFSMLPDLPDLEESGVA